jgi:hypothetical protein
MNASMYVCCRYFLLTFDESIQFNELIENVRKCQHGFVHILFIIYSHSSWNAKCITTKEWHLINHVMFNNYSSYRTIHFMHFPFSFPFDNLISTRVLKSKHTMTQNFRARHFLASTSPRMCIPHVAAMLPLKREMISTISPTIYWKHWQ